MIKDSLKNHLEKSLFRIPIFNRSIPAPSLRDQREDYLF
jgi:hypothetical protein